MNQVVILLGLMCVENADTDDSIYVVIINVSITRSRNRLEDELF